MAQNFIECDREQLLLMSPSLREWLPENHLAWFVIDAVKDMDLSAFYARYRPTRHRRSMRAPQQQSSAWWSMRSAPECPAASAPHRP
jgi:hypothetical protein